MAAFVEDERFGALNVGVALDEGLASPDDCFSVFYGERAPWWVDVVSEGTTGHGSRFVPDPAVHRLLRVAEKFLRFRQEQEEELRTQECGCGKTLGDVTTVNLTLLRAGTGASYNIVPSEAVAGFDIRIPPHVDLEEFERTLEQWVASEEGVRLRWVQKTPCNRSTSPKSPWFRLFLSALEPSGLPVRREIFPAATDSRFIRQLGIPAIGFSPMPKTPILLHDHNEFLNRDVFLRGISPFQDVIPALANASPEDVVDDSLRVE